ncbi:hypothetical protein M231_07522 [Tremella mesenterica]|uniref:ATP-dependent DNA helicase PIF1 n=1 Tax=Tremella mesenterica TaxID=5217 RepID=A0A4Q1B8X7_TREME|nr:hypothetical protein M231_07522 [Tremella mesenterica]
MVFSSSAVRHLRDWLELVSRGALTLRHLLPKAVLCNRSLPAGVTTPWQDDNGIPLLLIVPVTATWDGPSGTSCSRTQSALQLSYAITIHKLQGMTLDQAKIDLGAREFVVGLSFVAASQVKTLSGLTFQPGFPIERVVQSSYERNGLGTTRRLAQQDENHRQSLPYWE